MVRVETVKNESLRIRMEGSHHKYHEDHFAGKGMNSLSHHNMVRKFILVPQAMKIPDAKGSSVERVGKPEKIPAWQLTKVRNKNEVIAEARNEGRKGTCCVVDGSLSSQEFGFRASMSKVQTQSRTPR